MTRNLNKPFYVEESSNFDDTFSIARIDGYISMIEIPATNVKTRWIVLRSSKINSHITSSCTYCSTQFMGFSFNNSRPTQASRSTIYQFIVL